MPRLSLAFIVPALLCTPDVGWSATAGVPQKHDPVALVVNQFMGLQDSVVVQLAVDHAPQKALTVTVPLGGVDRVLDLAPHSVRGPSFQVLAQIEDGSFVAVDPGPVRTLRGTVRGIDGSIVTATMMPDGLRASVRLSAAETFWIEPIAAVIPGAVEHYVIYRDDAVSPVEGTCGTPDPDPADLHFEQFEVAAPWTTVGTGTPCAAQLAADADVEYYNAFGQSIPAVQARIESIVNTTNLQYEIQTSITHELGTILVRTAEPDPYISSGSSSLLCEFITEWTNNQTGIVRDVAILFTGRDISGGTIGQAADIGGTGICVSQGSCTGGPFGTQGSYCQVQAEFNGNFSCATDLVAHELGHLWGAFHCSCSSNTMNPGITCANDFTAGSIASIRAYRNTRSCLDGACDGMGCCRPDGTCEPIDCNANGIADECDLSSFSSSDCNANGIPDECDLANQIGDDCNSNGVLDDCELADFTDHNSGQLSPIGVGSPQSFTIVSPPVTTVDVILAVSAFGEFDGNLNSVVVKLNGQTIATMLGGTSGAGNCVVSGDITAIDRQVFNDLVAGGDAVFDFIASPIVDPNFCGAASYLDVTVSIGTASGLDGNENGVLDACECVADLTGPEGSPDANVDALDFLALIGQWGSPCAGSCEADITGSSPLVPDGNVDSLDFLLLISQWGSPANCP